MKYNVTLNNKTYEVEVERGEAILVGVSTVPVVAPAAAAAGTEVAAPIAPPAAATPAAPPQGGGNTVVAPMPGNIIEYKVKAGQAVAAGQVLLVLESMKMENEILAERGGTVGAILAQKGDVVDTGAPLLTLL